MNIVEHLERHLGSIEGGWASSSLPGVQVVTFRDLPAPGAITLGTLGLSNNPLAMPRGRYVREELLLACWRDAPLDDLAKLLLGMADLCVQSERAFVRGQVVPLGDRAVPYSHLSSMYASLPVVFPEGIATLADSTPATVVVWLIPIHASEAAFIAAHGWSAFEERLEKVDPDLYDLRRTSIA